MPSRSLAVAAVSLVVALTATACSSSDQASGDATSTTTRATDRTLTFYEPPTVINHGTPGDVLSKVPITLDTSLRGTGWRITYVSTTPAGDRVPVTGVLIQPLTPRPADGYPVVVWAHGTTGIAYDCAPSRHVPFSIGGAAPLLDAGVAIVAPDYEGQGIPGEIHPYLVGDSEGRNVLDAARAARAGGGGNVVAAWGGSQGGHAALFARSMQPDYAPELDFRGAAAQSPVTDVQELLVRVGTGDHISIFASYAIAAWAVVYSEPTLADMVVGVGDAEAAKLAREVCPGDSVGAAQHPLDERFRLDPLTVEPFVTALRVNSVTLGTSRAPVLLAHGDLDAIAPISGTNALFAQLCAANVPSVYLRDPSWDHDTAWTESSDQVDSWLLTRLAGDRAPTDC